MKKRCSYLIGSNPKKPLVLTLFVHGFSGVFPALSPKKNQARRNG